MAAARVVGQPAATATPAPAPIARPVVPARAIVALPHWAVWALAAAVLLVVATGTLAALLIQTRHERDAAQTAQWDAAAYLRDLGTDLRQGGVVQPMTAVAPPGPARPPIGSLIVAPNQPGGMVIIAGLPTADAGHIYRLWVERGGQRTTPHR